MSAGATGTIGVPVPAGGHTVAAGQQADGLLYLDIHQSFRFTGTVSALWLRPLPLHIHTA